MLGSGNLESTDGLHAVDELLLAPPERCVDVAPVLATGFKVGGFGYNRGHTICFRKRTNVFLEVTKRTWFGSVPARTRD